MLFFFHPKHGNISKTKTNIWCDIFQIKLHLLHCVYFNILLLTYIFLRDLCVSWPSHHLSHAWLTVFLCLSHVWVSPSHHYPDCVLHTVQRTLSSLGWRGSLVGQSSTTQMWSLPVLEIGSTKDSKHTHTFSQFFLIKFHYNSTVVSCIETMCVDFQ